MRRHLQLGRLEGIEIASQAAGLVLMIVWVLFDPTVWALVFGGWAASAVRLILSHGLAERRDRVGWEGAAARELFGFGAWILVSTLLTFVADQADRLILGRLVPLDVLGVYSIAAMFAALPATLVSRLGNTVVFPALSRKLEASAEALHEAFGRAQRTILTAGGVLVAAGAAAGPAGIAFLYDARYQEAGWMIPLLAAGAWWRVLAIPKGSLLLALGAGRAVALGNGAKTVVLLAAMPAGFALGGVPGAIGGLVLADLARYVAMSVATSGRGAGGIGRELGATAAVLASGAAGLLAARLLPAPAVVQAVAAVLGVAALWAPWLLRVARAEGWWPRGGASA
jgi:O-antigen/teichoic acid export membrane protein